MRNFELPTIEVMTFAVEDIITTSGNEQGGGPWETPEEEL